VLKNLLFFASKTIKCSTVLLAWAPLHEIITGCCSPTNSLILLLKMSRVVKNAATQFLAVRSNRRVFHRYHNHTALPGSDMIRCFSSSGTPDTNDGGGSSSTTSSKSSSARSSLRFPWRHSQHMLPKVEMEAARMQGNWRGQLSMAIWERSTALLVKNDFSQVLFGRQWRQDLADNSAWAWSLALASLLAKTFKGMCLPKKLWNGSYFRI